jgi:hypothetical protein
MTEFEQWWIGSQDESNFSGGSSVQIVLLLILSHRSNDERQQSAVRKVEVL